MAISTKFQGAYTADGQIIKLIFLHGGEIGDSLQSAYVDSFGFVLSDDGDVCYDGIGMAVQEVYRYFVNVQRNKIISLQHTLSILYFLCILLLHIL